MLLDVVGCVACNHLVERDYDEAPNSSGRVKGGVGGARKSSAAKANTAVDPEFTPLPLTLFLLGCVSDTQRSQTFPLKGM